MSLGQRLLVDAEGARHLVRPTSEATRDRTLHQVLRLVPRQPENLRGTGDVGLEQHVDGETLEQRGEPRAWLRPRHLDLSHAVLAAVHPRDPCVQVRQELAAVEVAPDPLLVVVVQAAGDATLRARPALRLSVPGVDVDALPLHVELDPADSPGSGEAEKVLVQLGVAHQGTVADRGPPGPRGRSPAAARPASRPRSAERSEGSLARQGRAEAPLRRTSPRWPTRFPEGPQFMGGRLAKWSGSPNA